MTSDHILYGKLTKYNIANTSGLFVITLSLLYYNNTEKSQREGEKLLLYETAMNPHINVIIIQNN